MDFESRLDCCRAWNSISFQCPNNKTLTQIHGEGDCKCNNEVQGRKNAWMVLDKEKKLRNKFTRERNDSESPADQQKKFQDGHCYCFEKQNFSDKAKPEMKQEREVGNFDNCNYFWDSSPGHWSKNERFFLASEQPKGGDCSNYVKLLADTNFEEKVDFLFRIFKDYGQKFPAVGYLDQSKKTEEMFTDMGHLFDFNKRLCAAEEGIEKLALILEDLVKESSKNKSSENVTYGDSLDFDELSVPERISYLKSRNDLMLGFMEAFLKAGPVQETYARLCPTPNDFELKELNQMQLSTQTGHDEKQPLNDINRIRIMETLKKLRMRMTELRQKKYQRYNEQHNTRGEKKGETALKYARNKLEVISEQAELALSDESENDFSGKKSVRNINQKLSEVNEESDDSDLSVRDVTFRILSENANLLKPPLDKLIFSKLDSPDKKFGSNIQISIQEDNNQGDVAINYDTSGVQVHGNAVRWSKDLMKPGQKASESAPNSTSGAEWEVGCFFCDGGSTEKFKDRNQQSNVIGMCTKQKEFKQQTKKEKPPLEKTSKPNTGTSNKKTEVYLEGSVRSTRKILQNAVFQSKGSRTVCSIPELCSSSREEWKKETKGKEQRQRPKTDPSSHRKTLPPSGLKPMVPEKYTTKNSGLNNVKNKNKILLSKKSCVQTP